MLVFLPLLAFAFLADGFRRKQADWRESLLLASVPWSLFVAFITEVLTQFRFLTWIGIAWSWLVFAFLCFMWSWKTGRATQTGADVADTTKEKNSPLPWDDRASLIIMVAIGTLIALTALVSAPNTWDAMEYHLPRVVEWINDRGVQFFPTIDWAQLNQPPFAEYVMLHLDLLYGSDRLVALVQWFCYAGCILTASLIAKELGGARRAQIVAAIFTATIPMALLEGSGTKTEVVAAYWIALAVYLLLHWRRSQDWPHALAIGAALGLAVFTKGTSYVFLPCIVLACALMWNRTAKRGFFLRLPAIAAMGILVCAPLWVRNYRDSGSPLGLPYFYGVGDLNTRMYATARATPTLALANVARNVALHAGVPSARINTLSTRAFSRLIRAMGVDPNAPGQIMASQLGYMPRFAVRFKPRNEVLSEDPIHFLLFLLAGAMVLIHYRRFKGPVHWFGLGIVGAFILFCALLRWSPWSARLQLPLFVLGAAFSAVVLVNVLPRWAVNAIGGLLLLLALPLALANDTRPLIARHGLRGSILTTPRDQTYFFDSHPEMAASFVAAAQAARASNCRNIGIDANLLHFEYPMMAMLAQDGVPRQIRYVDVENSSARYAQPSRQPVCMVICLGCRNHPEKIAEYSATLPKTQSCGNLLLFTEPTH